MRSTVRPSRSRATTSSPPCCRRWPSGARSTLRWSVARSHRRPPKPCARRSTECLQGRTDLVPLRPMGQSIAAKYAARPAARFVRPSSRARERRLGLGAQATFSAASTAQTELPGLEVRITGPLDRIEYSFVQSGTRIHKTVHYFLMEPVGGDLERHDHEFEQVRWINFADAPTVLTFETERALVAQAAIVLAPPSAAERAS